MSCEGCWTSAKGQSEQLNIIRAQAKAYAVEIQKAVAIYKEGYDLYYGEATAVIGEGKNIIEVVSFL